jgi:hypothetical protein
LNAKVVPRAVVGSRLRWIIGIAATSRDRLEIRYGVCVIAVIRLAKATAV